MTANEKLRLLAKAERAGATPIDFDLSRAPLTKLCLYILRYSLQERRSRARSLPPRCGAAERALGHGPQRRRLGRVAAILDRSFLGLRFAGKAATTLAVALAASQILRAASREYGPSGRQACRPCLMCRQALAPPPPRQGW